MTTEHPITPPPELVRQWAVYKTGHESPVQLWYNVANQAAQWGADAELEACCEWLPSDLTINGESLRAARRPKPPSLAEGALEALEDGDIGPAASLTPVEVCIIRRALERLKELEKGNE